MENKKKSLSGIYMIGGLMVILWGIRIYTTGEWSKPFLEPVEVKEPKIVGILVIIWGVLIIIEWIYRYIKSKHES